jgi:diguanylate cyclase (GGDEF)-like protein
LAPPPSAPEGDDAGRGGRLARLRRSTGDDQPAVATAAPASEAVDPVSGLATRSALDGWVAEAIAHSEIASNRALVAFVDIDLLRDVNDSFGPDAGDQLLRAVGDRLAGIDLPGTRALRYEGAEFAVVFGNIDQVEMAEQIAQFLIDLLSPAFQIGGELLRITPIVGAALSSDNYASQQDFTRDAHRALVRARDGGPGAWIVHDESRRGRYETRVNEERLSDALRNEEFFLAYQPIVRLDNEQMIGVEALIRWQAPSATNTGMLMPQDFFPLLEKSGLSVPVGRWVIAEACRQAAVWNKRFPDRPALFVTCNVSARQLASSEFQEEVLAAVGASGVHAWQLCIDLTEQALRYNRTTAWAALRALKDRGVKLGLDDFGTGMSSLTYLRDFQLDLVRIDRLFVDGLAHNVEDRAIIKHIAALGHELGLIVIAEGVETPEQAEILRTLGVDLAQGFHFGRPTRAGGIVARLDPDADHSDEWDTTQVLDHDGTYQGP